MASLTGSLLQLTSLLDGLSELGIVKKHLLRAGREILMAVQSLLGLAENYATGLTEGADRQQAIQSTIGYAQRILQSLAEQLPKGDDEEYRSLHRKVMNSILEVLEREIRKNSKMKAEKSKMKSEVYEAIRQVLLRQMYERDSEPVVVEKKTKK